MVQLNKFFKALLCCCFIPLVLSQRSTQYVVKVALNGQVKCGGTLVANNFVVTAAHCIQDVRNPQLLTVIGGLFDPAGTRVVSRVTRTFRPGDFNRKTMDKDLAVLKLLTPLNGTSTNPIGLCSRGWKHGDPVTIYDWNISAPRTLRTVYLKVVGREKCADRYRNRRALTDTMFCAAASGGDGCYSATGGPVMVHGEFCGIVSSPAGCANQASPAIFTNVLHELEFIRKNMQK